MTTTTTTTETCGAVHMSAKGVRRVCNAAPYHDDNRHYYVTDTKQPAAPALSGELLQLAFDALYLTSDGVGCNYCSDESFGPHDEGWVQLAVEHLTAAHPEHLDVA